MTIEHEELRRKIDAREAVVAVMGLGYVGLPTAVTAATVGYRTFGLDPDIEKLGLLARGISYVDDVPSSAVAELVKAHRLVPTSDFTALRDADIVVVCVPTPLTDGKVPDLSMLDAACTQVSEFAHPGMLVSIESTTYPGSTEEMVAERLAKRGLRVGHDIFVSYSPERIDPGNAKFTLRNTPKIVGGMDPASLVIAQAFYTSIVDSVVPVSSSRLAEFTKLLENTFRAVNIAFINEMAMLAERLEIDIWEAIEAASTKPFGYVPFYPGPGIGGHCIPLDPAYLSWKARSYDFYSRFIELALEINAGMPRAVVAKVGEALNRVGKSLKGSKILLLGVAYKRDTSDVREAPAVKVWEILERAGAIVEYSDPFVKEVVRHGRSERTVEMSPRRIAAYDAVVLITDHSTFDYAQVADFAKIVVDTRNAFGRQHANVVRLGAPSRSVASEEVAVGGDQ